MATLAELEQGLIAADAAGNSEDAKIFADEIRRMRGDGMSALGMAARASVQQHDPDGPSAAGAFAREGARSVAPGVAGFFGGAGAGALAGMAGGPAAPITVPVAAIVGGLASAFGARKLQDYAVDNTFGADSWLGSQSAAQDYQSHPYASFAGGLLASGKPSLARVGSAVKAVGTAEGRAALGQVARSIGDDMAAAELQRVNPAAVNAFGDTIDVASGAGLGAGMSMASGESPGMVIANLLGGAAFNKPWLGGSNAVLPHPSIAPEAPRPAGPMPVETPNTALIDPVIKAKVTRIPGTSVEEYSPPFVPNQPKLMGPLALPEPEPTPRLPLAEAPLAEGPAADSWIQAAVADFMARQESAPPPNPPDNPFVAREMANRLGEIAPKDAEGKPMGPEVAPREVMPVQAETPQPKKGAPLPVNDLEAAMQRVTARNAAPPEPLPANEPNHQAPELQPRFPVEEVPTNQLENPAAPDLPEGRAVPVAGEEGSGGQRDLDSEYMAAVTRGDMETAQRMVEDAAERAGYTKRGSRGGAYHKGVPLEPSAHANFGPGYYIAEGKSADLSSIKEFSKPINPAAAKSAGIPVSDLEPRAERVAAKADHPFILDGWNSTKLTPEQEALLRAEMELEAAINTAHHKAGSDREWATKADRSIFGRDEDFTRVLAKLIREGKLPFDSIRGIGGRTHSGKMDAELVVHRPGQMKSLEPVTRDSAGEVVPLSKRFDPESESILGPQPFPTKGDQTLRDKLQAHSNRVSQAIWRDIAEGRNYSSIFGPLNATTAKQAYKVAVDAAIAAIDLGDRIGKAVNKAVQSVKAHLGAAWKPEMEGPLRKDLAKNLPGEIDKRRLEKQQLGDYARKQVVGDTKEGAPKPSEAEFKQRVAKDLPDQRGNIDAEEAPQTAYDDPDLKAGDYPDAGKNTEWRDYHERTGDTAERVVQDLKSGKTAREFGQKVAAINRELFKSKSAVAHDAADGKMPGTSRSAAAKEFVDHVFGTQPGADGVAKTGADADFQRNVTKRANGLDKILDGLEPRMARMGQQDRRAFLDRVGDLMTDANADLAREPKDVQKAIAELRNFYDSTRADLKEAGYDVGDFGAHSMPRIFKADMRANNPTAFHRDLVETYKAKFKREIEEAGGKVTLAEKKIGTAEGDKEWIKAKKELEALRKDLTTAEAERRALAYERNLAMNDAGIAVDGDDFKMGGEDGMPNFLKAREFGEEADRLLGKYYVRNPFEVAKITGETTERLLTMARVLGKKDKDGNLDRTGRWKDLRDKLMAEGNEKMVPELARVIANTFGLGERVGPKTQKFAEFTRTWMWLSFLDRAAVSSLAEPLMAGISTRSVGNAAKAFAKTVRQAARRFAKLPANESRIIAESLGYVQSGIMSRLSAAHASDPFASGGMAKTADSFFNMTGLTGWTHSTTEAISDIGFEHLAALAKLAKTNKLARKDLEGFGVKADEIDLLDGFADNMKADRMGSILGDAPGAEVMRRAHANYMRQSVVMPTHGDKALHAAHPVGQMFYGLQAYLYGYNRNITGKLYRRAMQAAGDKEMSASQKAKVIGTLPAAFLGMGAANLAITLLRENLFVDPERKRKDAKKTEGEIWKGRLMASASRANFLGAYDPLFNALTAAKYQRDPATVMVGPVWGAASELFSQLAMQGGERDSANTNTAERKIARLAYQIGVKPATSAFLSGLPAARAAGVANYAISHPFARETFTRATAGKASDKNNTKKGPLPVF